MFRFKVLLLSLLAVMAVGSVASTVASAALEGPWWRHPEGGKQVKWKLNEEHEVKSINEGGFQLKSIIAGSPATIQCNSAKDKGNIWNGLHQGEDNTEVTWGECSLLEPCKVTGVTVGETKAFTELMWKYRGEAKELTEVGQQKIYDTFAPTGTPEEVGAGKGEFQAPFTKINIPVGTVCTGTLTVFARGPRTTFIDQNNEEHAIVWGTAALVEPQNADATAGHLTWLDPNIKELHHQATVIKPRLFLGTNPAELQGKIKVELTAGGEFGAFNE